MILHIWRILRIMDISVHVDTWWFSIGCIEWVWTHSFLIGVLAPSLGVVTPVFIHVSNLFHGPTLVLTGHHLVQLTKGKTSA